VTRCVAGVVDGLIALVLVVLGALGVNAVRFLLRPRTFEAAPIDLAPAVGVFLVTLALYLAAAWALVGRTYGCHLLGLRVVDRRGAMPGVLLAIARAAFCVLFPLGLLWCAVGRSRRSVQDLVLGTRVIYDWMPRPREGSPGTGEAGRRTGT